MHAIRNLLLTLVLLLALLGIELGMLLAPPTYSMGSFVLLPAAIMVAIVATGFMDLRREPTLVHLFVAAGLVGLMILLGLGAMDPLTRSMSYAPGYFEPGGQ